MTIRLSGENKYQDVNKLISKALAVLWAALEHIAMHPWKYSHWTLQKIPVIAGRLAQGRGEEVRKWKRKPVGKKHGRGRMGMKRGKEEKGKEG